MPGRKISGEREEAELLQLRLDMRSLKVPGLGIFLHLLILPRGQVCRHELCANGRLQIVPHWKVQRQPLLLLRQLS